MGWLVFYIGGCVATATALLAVSRQPYAGSTFKGKGHTWHALLLCLFWLPLLVVAAVYPKCVNRKRRR